MSLGFEITFLLLYLFIDVVRVRLGTRGNLTETVSPLVVSLVLTLPLIMGNLFFLYLQTYVLHVEQVINVIFLVLQCVEFVLGLGAAFVISKGQSV